MNDKEIVHDLAGASRRIECAAAVGIFLDCARNACGLKATSIVNNSHLKELTTADTVLDSVNFADCTAKMLGLPISFTAAPKAVSDALNNIPNVYPIDIYVRTPWEQGGNSKWQE